MKTCKDCKKDKPISAFGINGTYRLARCKPCHKRWTKEKAAKWYASNRERHNQRKRDEYIRHKQLVFAHYGEECVCCGESEPLFLTVDHIENDGHEHRKGLNTSHHNIYNWLVRNNYPDGFQTLCSNCNHGKHRNGGICPHQSNSRT